MRGGGVQAFDLYIQDIPKTRCFLAFESIINQWKNILFDW